MHKNLKFKPKTFLKRNQE